MLFVFNSVKKSKKQTCNYVVIAVSICLCFKVFSNTSIGQGWV